MVYHSISLNVPFRCDKYSDEIRLTEACNNIGKAGTCDNYQQACLSLLGYLTSQRQPASLYRFDLRK